MSRSKYLQNGITIVELIIVMVVVAILMVGASQILQQGFRSFFLAKNIVNLNWHANLALERLGRDLRFTRLISDIHTATDGIITITNLQGKEITYRVMNKQLLRNNQFLANNVQSIDFDYYNTNAVQYFLPLSESQRLSIGYVKVTLNMQHGPLNFPVRTAFYLWNKHD